MPGSSLVRIILVFAVFLAMNACTPKQKTDNNSDINTKTSTIVEDRKTPVIHYKISVAIQAETHGLHAKNIMTIPPELARDGLRFFLNSELEPKVENTNLRIKLIKKDETAKDIGMDRDNDVSQKDSEDSVIRLNVYEITGFKPGNKAVLPLIISGKINNPIKQLGEEYSRGFSSSPGIIEKRGVYLAGATYWIPSIENTYVSYDMEVKSPPGWSSVSQGRLEEFKQSNEGHIDRWVVDTPTEEIYVIAAKFTRYEKEIASIKGGKNIKVMAYLRTPDPALANKYITTTAQYMEMYEDLIGDYPYSKFALVENFWETGYGMPSFTLLGSQIIRFPFILHSSYPHELLHNWWGNSVYIDFDTGNWAEGLTAYMADHLVAEGRSQGAQYRRSLLQSYTNYVNDKNDFALKDFISRSNAATQAVGYGKTAMVFDMLRVKFGDEVFKRALSQFYQKHKFSTAGWNDIKNAFAEETKQNLDWFFKQWIDGTGAPELAIEKVYQEANRLTLMLKQNQNRQAFNLDIPIAVYSRDNIVLHKVNMHKKLQVFSLPVDGKIVRVEIDPEFNIFRRLHFSEIPPSLGAVFGAKQVLIVLPDNTSPTLKNRYKKLADLWSGRENVKIVKDSDLQDLPDDAAIWIFGRGNKFYHIIEKALPIYNAKIDNSTLIIDGKSLKLDDNSSVITIRNPKNPQAGMVGLTAHSDAAIAGLARKLPHYGKYSYLAFSGDEPTNTAKGQWQVMESPMIAVLDKNIKPEAKLKKRPALAQIKPLFDADKMLQTVKILSADNMQGRGAGSKGLDKAADYIAAEFAKAGLKPAGDNGYFQTFQMKGENDKPISNKNIIGIIKGTNPDFSNEPVIISAHYDHLGLGWPNGRAQYKGQIHPGADDNASGIAVMLEIARSLAKTSPERSIIFFASAGEEAGLLGAKHYIKTHQKDKIFANVNLDTVGRAGDKVLIFGTDSAREWPFIFMGIKAVTGIDTELVKQSITASDHGAFLQAGIPAIHIFGQASEDYHRPSDTYEKISKDSLLRVAIITKEVLEYLAGRTKPMTNQINKTDNNANKTSASTQVNSNSRKVSTGTMPDFAYNGIGVKIAQIAPESAGAKAGLQAGDIITEFGGEKIKNLRDYTKALKKYKPGDKVKMQIKRGDKTMKLSIILDER